MVRKGSRGRKQTNLVKYFAHGVPSATVMLLGGLAMYYSLRNHWFPEMPEMQWAFVWVDFSVAIVIVFSLGLANSYLARALWGVRVKKTVLNLFLYGAMHYALMGLFLVPLMFLALAEDYIFALAACIAFVSDALMSGYMGRHLTVDVGPLRSGKKKKLASIRDERRTCPSCGTEVAARDLGVMACPECHTVLQGEDEETGPDTM